MLHFFKKNKKSCSLIALATISQISMFFWVFANDYFKNSSIQESRGTLGSRYVSSYFEIVYYLIHDPVQVFSSYGYLGLLNHGLDFTSTLIFFAAPSLMMFMPETIRANLPLRITVIVSLIYLMYANYWFPYYLWIFRGESVYAYFAIFFFAINYLVLLVSYIICRRRPWGCN
jgi:hypothetical protein